MFLNLAMLLPEPGPEKIIEAHKIISPFIELTPVIEKPDINAMVGGRVLFKCENLQKVKAFKARGALYAVMKLKPEQVARGVATHSSGNHAQALAYAASLIPCKAFVVMPSNSSEVKKQGVKELGGEIFECEPGQEAREAMLREVVEKTGASFIPPFDHPDIIAGQGTAAREFLEIYPDLELLLTPVGGGGLLSGTSIWAKHFSNKIEVYGCEPREVDDAYRSFISGKVEKNDSGNQTMADGLRTSLSELTLRIIRKNCAGIIRVSEPEIESARMLMEKHLGIPVELSSAVPFAAMLSKPEKFRGKTTGIIITGGNR